MLGGMGKYAMYGASIGAVIPIPGVNVIVGAMAGAAVGGILGWLGTDKLDKFGKDVFKQLDECLIQPVSTFFPG